MTSDLPSVGQEHFVAFIDLLGFSEASTETDEATRSKVLELLQSISSLRADFKLQSTPQHGGRTIQITPAVSTFSDHIVISFPIEPIRKDLELENNFAVHFILLQFSRMLTSIAASALRIGFLVRGGATIGSLFHVQGVVFGPALIEAVQIESEIAIFPRVVLAPALKNWQDMLVQTRTILKADDGLYHFDYFQELATVNAVPGDNFKTYIQSWYTDAIGVVTKNLKSLEAAGKQKELAKWTWFAHQFRSGLERIPPDILNAFGLSLEAMNWPR